MSFMMEYIILYEYSQQGELLVKLKLSYLFTTLSTA